MDYTSLRNLAVCLGKLFGRIWSLHHPGIDRCASTPEVAAAWKPAGRDQTHPSRQRLRTDRRRSALRSDHGINYLSMVRAFYLDVAHMGDGRPAAMGSWAAPCPIRDEEMSFKKGPQPPQGPHGRPTRERMPVLPVPGEHRGRERIATAERLQAAHWPAPVRLHCQRPNTAAIGDVQ